MLLLFVEIFNLSFIWLKKTNCWVLSCIIWDKYVLFFPRIFKYHELHVILFVVVFNAGDWRALYTLGNCSTTELHSQHLCWFLNIIYLHTENELNFDMFLYIIKFSLERIYIYASHWVHNWDWLMFFLSHAVPVIFYMHF